MIDQIADFWRSQTSRLLLIYLAIIMAMSISFSLVIYAVSSSYLERQVVDDSYFAAEGSQFVPTDRLKQYRQYVRENVRDGKRGLVVQLYVLNLVMLLFGAAFSFVLARWTLEPIERNMAAQTKFVSDASHELRTPLTAIQAANEVALRRKKLTLAEARRILQDNLDDVQRLQQMSTMLLQAATTKSQLQLVPIDTRTIVEQAISDTVAQARERGITIQYDGVKRNVSADVHTAAQALTILLDNAIKYSPKDEVVTITTASNRRGYTAIAVRDNGAGIAKSEQRNIFLRFYRSDEARSRSKKGGYGLGLDIAQKIAAAHGGSIELVSKPGAGSTFRLILPNA
ncbi:hypothetical protein CR983_02075 [Candidatus Saccharibacteria bacterium]|nr:MAG: hypothetical protein CR983_02075 [Candidatus Saccharibacteria bacterium]